MSARVPGAAPGAGRPGESLVRGLPCRGEPIGEHSSPPGAISAEIASGVKSEALLSQAGLSAKEGVAGLGNLSGPGVVRPPERTSRAQGEEEEAGIHVRPAGMS